MFDFDNEHVTRHLVYARKNGVEVECIGDWAQVSPMNASENIARLRRAGIRVYGVVRNDPTRLRGGHREHAHEIHPLRRRGGPLGLVQPPFPPLGRQLGERPGLPLAGRARSSTQPSTGRCERTKGDASAWTRLARYNLYYSFGTYHCRARGVLRPQDAIITEIENARRSIVVCMFDLASIRGSAFGSETRPT